MLIIYWVSIIIFGIDAIYINYKLWTAIKYLLGLRDISLLSKNIKREDINLEILIPVLNEQDIIEETINYYHKIAMFASSYMANIIVVLIGSCKEDKSSVSTLDIANNYINAKSFSYFKLIYCPTPGSKATQLNYYINRHNKKNIWYLISDVDSRPEIAFVKTIVNMSLIKTNLYQLIPNYLKNIKSGSTLIERIISMNQSIFSLSTEYFNSIECLSLLNKYKSSSIIGHGMILHSDLYNKIGGFPDPIEDSRLANITVINSIPVKFLPIFDHSTVPTSVVPAIKQYSGWFYGQMFIFYDMRIIFLKLFKTRIYIKFFHRIAINLYWLLKTLFVISIIVALCITSNLLLLIIFILLLILSHTKVFMLNKLITNNKITFRHAFESIIWDFFYSLGPLLYLVKLVKNIIQKKDTIDYLPKTKKRLNIM